MHVMQLNQVQQDAREQVGRENLSEGVREWVRKWKGLLLWGVIARTQNALWEEDREGGEGGVERAEGGGDVEGGGLATHDVEAGEEEEEAEMSEWENIYCAAVSRPKI